MMRKRRQQHVNQLLCVVKQCSIWVHTTTSLAAILASQNLSSETSGIWENFTSNVLKTSKTYDARYVLKKE
jgi:hypothetical protein